MNAMSYGKNEKSMAVNESICAYIYSDDKNKDENYRIYKYELFPDFVKLRKLFDNCNYFIDLIDNNELTKLLEED